MENIYLLGSEDVRFGGLMMQNAADSIRNSANSIASSVEEQKRILDEFLIRLENILDKS